MKRKVIQIANSTQLVSLPRKWALEHGVKKGDELHLDVQPHGITISTSKKNTPSRTIEFDCSGMDRNVKRVIGALYRAGYDEILIRFSDYHDLEPVQTIVRESCIGFETIEQNPKYVVVKKVSEAMDEEFDPIMKRLVMFVLTMSKETVSATKTHNPEQLQYVAQMDLSINKFTDFCGRVVSSKGRRENWTLFPAIMELERLGDEYKRFCRMLIKQNIIATPRIISALEDIDKFVNATYDIIFKFSQQLLSNSYNQHSQIRNTLRKIDKNATANELRCLHYLQNILNAADDIGDHLIVHHCTNENTKNLTHPDQESDRN